MIPNEWSDSVGRYLPERETALEIARAAGQSVASRRHSRKVFKSAEHAFEHIDPIFTAIVSRPGLNISRLTKPKKLSLAEALEEFCDAFFRGGEEYIAGEVPKRQPLNVNVIGSAYGCCEFASTGTVSLAANKYSVSCEPSHSGPGPRNGGVWVMQVTQGRFPIKRLVKAVVDLDLRYVGPLIVNWEGEDLAQGLAVLLEVLEKAFGKSLGIAVSEWKVTQAGLNLANRHGGWSELVPPEFGPLLRLKRESGKTCRTSPVEEGASDSDDASGEPNPWLRASISEYVEQVAKTLETMYRGLDQSLVSDLRDVIRLFSDEPDDGDEQSLWDDE